MLVKLFIRHCVCGCGCGCGCVINHFPLSDVIGDFIAGIVIIPLADDFFGFWVVQGGEGVVGQLAKQVLGAVDFKRVK